jgi:hypothetical protein
LLFSPMSSWKYKFFFLAAAPLSVCNNWIINHCGHSHHLLLARKVYNLFKSVNNFPLINDRLYTHRTSGCIIFKYSTGW